MSFFLFCFSSSIFFLTSRLFSRLEPIALSYTPRSSFTYSYSHVCMRVRVRACACLLL
jgi:hypothetical protein